MNLVEKYMLLKLKLVINLKAIYFAGKYAICIHRGCYNNIDSYSYDEQNIANALNLNAKEFITICAKYADASELKYDYYIYNNKETCLKCIDELYKYSVYKYKKQYCYDIKEKIKWNQ